MMHWSAIVVLGWLGVCAVWDWRTRTVPNALTIPAIPIAAWLSWKAGYTLDWHAVVLVGAYMALWLLGVFGGADAKVGIGLALYSPLWAYGAMWGVIIFAGARRVLGVASTEAPAIPAMFCGALLTSILSVAIMKMSIVGVARLSREAQAMGFLF